MPRMDDFGIWEVDETTKEARRLEETDRACVPAGRSNGAAPRPVRLAPHRFGEAHGSFRSRR